MQRKMKTVRFQALASAVALGVASMLANATAAAPDAIVDAPGLVARNSQAATGADIEQRLRAELRVTMAELIESGAFGTTSPEKISLDMDTPAQRVSDLGLVVDNAHGSGVGLTVLGVTPGGSAERMGLRAGDTLVSLNGATLPSGAEGASNLRRQIDELPNATAFDIGIRRDGNPQQLRGMSASVYVPAMHLSIGDGQRVASNGSSEVPGNASASTSNGCGRISDFDVAPRQQQLHRAKIILIDGVTPGPSGSKSFRVAAGSHQVKVAESIESRYLSFSDVQRNAGTTDDRYKTISVDVAPDTTVLVAARLNEDQRNNAANGAYWDPVAWKTNNETCH